jgi:hypothetical protein
MKDKGTSVGVFCEGYHMIATSRCTLSSGNIATPGQGNRIIAELTSINFMRVQTLNVRGGCRHSRSITLITLGTLAVTIALGRVNEARPGGREWITMFDGYCMIRVSKPVRGLQCALVPLYMTKGHPWQDREEEE